MVELIPAVCPQCGGELQVPKDLDEAHCLYCGTKFLIDKETEQHVHYHVQQATFICDVCGRRWPYSENSGVQGSRVCFDCYDEAKIKGWFIRIAGIVIAFFGVGIVISRIEICILPGIIILITGIIIMGWANYVAYEK